MLQQKCISFQLIIVQSSSSDTKVVKSDLNLILNCLFLNALWASLAGSLPARMRALLHGQSPGVRIRILKFSECLTDIVSVFEGLNNVVDEVFSSCIIIGCLLG
jgi:hypothetical protein